MKKLTFLFALTLSLGVQAQDENIDNGTKINFKNSAGALDGTSLYRNSGSHMRFEFFNHFDFKSLNGGYIKIRNANKISIKLNPNGDSYFDDGNIGFGTKSPEELLHLKRNNATIKLSSGQYHQTDGTVISRIKFNNHNTGNTSLDYSSEIRGILTGSSAQLVGMQFLTLGAVRMHIDDGGNVGIGTDDPNEKLHLKENNNGSDVSFKMSAKNTGGTGRRWFLTGDPDARKLHIGEEARSNDFVIDNDGNIGIGTSTPSAMLSVAGKMDAQEIEVKVDAGVVPDYVFASDYNLTTLEETADYIKENHHLPEIPSAKAMEANGMNVGEMNLLLLKKIEELTLHLIEMKAKNEELEERINNIENQ